MNGKHLSGKEWYLVADIGGTNARFGVADCQTGELQSVRRYSVAEYGEFTAALKEFLREVGSGEWRPAPAATCFAVACPPDGEILPFTNSPWVIDRKAVTELLGGNPVHIINDFAAVGYGVIDLQEADWHQLGGGAALADRPIAVLGPGTGLGVCSVVPLGSVYGVASGEGGHVDFAPNDRQERALLELLTEEFGHVSIERLLSGAGIVTLYRGLAKLAGTQPAEYSPADITAAAVSGSDDLAVEALTTFCRILGSVAGNLALTLGAKGGVYIAGGILPRFIDFAATSGLRERFEAKGRFQSYLASIPLRVIVKEDLGLHGAIKKLS